MRPNTSIGADGAGETPSAAARLLAYEFTPWNTNKGSWRSWTPEQPLLAIQEKKQRPLCNLRALRGGIFQPADTVRFSTRFSYFSPWMMCFTKMPGVITWSGSI